MTFIKRLLCYISVTEYWVFHHQDTLETKIKFLCVSNFEQYMSNYISINLFIVYDLCFYFKKVVPVEKMKQEVAVAVFLLFFQQGYSHF